MSSFVTSCKSRKFFVESPLLYQVLYKIMDKRPFFVHQITHFMFCRGGNDACIRINSLFSVPGTYIPRMQHIHPACGKCMFSHWSPNIGGVCLNEWNIICNNDSHRYCPAAHSRRGSPSLLPERRLLAGESGRNAR